MRPAKKIRTEIPTRNNRESKLNLGKAKSIKALQIKRKMSRIVLLKLNNLNTTTMAKKNNQK